MQIDWNQSYLEGRDYRIMSQLLLDNIWQATNVAATGTALDIGCGTGDLAVKLAKRGFTVLGIDSSETAIEKAQKRSVEAGVADQATFQVLDPNILEQSVTLENQTFDLITCKLVLAFIANKPALLSWIKSHLSQVGTFALITPVLHHDIEYGPRLRNISVDYSDLMTLLQWHFSTVQEVHKDYFEEVGDERTFILR